MLASGTDDGTIELWDVGLGKLHSKLAEHKSWILSLTWSPERQTLASGSYDGTIRLWEIESGKSRQIIQKHDYEISAGAFSPNGRVFASGGSDGIVRLWDAETDNILQVLESHDAPVCSVSWSPDGGKLASGATDGSIRLWSTKKGKLIKRLNRHRAPVRRLTWSPNGRTLASSADDGSILIWMVRTGKFCRMLAEQKSPVHGLDFSPDGRTLASGADDGTIQLWNAETGKLNNTLGERHNFFVGAGLSLNTDFLDEYIDTSILTSGNKMEILSPPYSVSRIGDQALDSKAFEAVKGISIISDNEMEEWASRFYQVPNQELKESLTQLLDVKSELDEYRRKLELLRRTNKSIWFTANNKEESRYHTSQTHKESIKSEISPSKYSPFIIDKKDRVVHSLEEYLQESKKNKDIVRCVAWSINGLHLASGGENGIVQVWNVETGSLYRTLEGHNSPIINILWGANGRLLVSRSEDDNIRIWRCDTWEIVKVIDKPILKYLSFDLSLFSIGAVSSVLADGGTIIHIWELDLDLLLNAASPSISIHYTSAKIVLVGESNVGKSCLALRLAENRYEEQGTTHGMRVWPMSPEQLNSDTITPPGEKRDVVLWDMGGQDEYRLIHQLFLHDTTMALLLMDPTRGRTAFSEVEGWNLRLEKQLEGRKTTKLLVGTKLDEESSIIDRAGLERLVKECGVIGYYPTSAKTNRGIAHLRKSISEAINWDFLTKTSRPALFQHIRDEIERRRKGGEVVLLLSELEEQMRREFPDQFDSKSVSTVVEQLTLQGVITGIRLASGERVLVVQISEIERYAGSLIIAARNNPTGVPALEEHLVASTKMSFPGIKKEERLHRFQERIILECVVQLLIEHGICLKHEGLLIFPSLFQPTEKGDSTVIPHSISLYYDFSGAINNIYSSLVVRLATSEQFGRVRLWEDRAEFERLGQGICGLRKVEHRSGLAHLDLFFSEQTPNIVRDLFMVFVEEHLRKEGVSITEVLEVTCACGYRFQESSLRKRLAEGHADIICPECEIRSPISEGAKKARSNSLEIEESLLALKTIIYKKSKEAVIEMKIAFGEAEQIQLVTKPTRILHLSDLHINSDDDPVSLMQPIIKDLEDSKGGLGVEQLDYLVLSGDLTNRGTTEEFEQVYQFVSGLIEHFKLTAGRCIIVPGNHDLSWDYTVYEWKQRRLANLEGLKEVHTRSMRSKGGVWEGWAVWPAQSPHEKRTYYDFVPPSFNVLVN